MLRNARSDSGFARAVADSLGVVILLLQFRGPKRNLASVIEQYSGWQCSKLRDTIFSLLNICTPIDVSIDYRKPINDIFIDTTRSITDQEQNLKILCSRKNLQGKAVPRTSQTRASCQTTQIDSVLERRQLFPYCGHVQDFRTATYTKWGTDTKK